MRTIHVLVFAYFLTVCSGCSVGMAMSGKKAPNLGLVQEGASRGQIELQLGPPIKTSSLGNGKRMDVYEYETGNEPSAGRAIGHAIMDILTFGLWEILGTPIEGFIGDKYQLTVLYDERDRVASINQPEKIVEPTATAQAQKGSSEELLADALGESSEPFEEKQPIHSQLAEPSSVPAPEIVQPPVRAATIYPQKKPEIRKISTRAAVSKGNTRLGRDKEECRIIASNHETLPYKKAFLGCMKTRGWVKKKR